MALVTKTKRKPAAHQKKRTAQHHRQSKHYVKAYWPYLPMALIMVLGFAVNTFWSAHSVLGASSDFSSTSLLSDTNVQRTGDKEALLSLNPQLSAAAQAKANDMTSRDYWSHNTPDGKTPWTFMTAAGYNYQKAGENLAYGFNGADATIKGWMNSPEHRANILGADYSEVGFGVASSPNYQGKGPATVVVAMYGEPAGAAANITFTVKQPAVAGDSTANREPAAQLVSRVQLLTGGNAPWSLLAVSIIASSALTLFVIRHGLRLKKLVSQGELYVLTHPTFDLGIVLLFTIGFILTRASGVIR